MTGGYYRLHTTIVEGITFGEIDYRKSILDISFHILYLKYKHFNPLQESVHLEVIPLAVSSSVKIWPEMG